MLPRGRLGEANGFARGLGWRPLIRYGLNRPSRQAEGAIVDAAAGSNVLTMS